MYPSGVTVKEPESLLLMQTSAFTQEIEGCFNVLDGGRNDSLHLRSLALEVFFTHNTFAVPSTMLPAFLDLGVGSQKAISFPIRSTVRKLKVDLKFDYTWHSRNRGIGDELSGLRNCPDLRSLHVVVQAVPWYNFLNYDLESTTVQIWTVLEDLKAGLGQGLTVTMKAVKRVPFNYPVCPKTGRILNWRNDEPRVFNYFNWLSLDFEMYKDVTWMWEAPTDAVRNKYLNSTHDWMEELTVLMFDEEANKEARVEYDTDSRPLSKNMDMLKARRTMLKTMIHGWNEGKFRNSRLLTPEAFALVQQRFESTT